MHLVPVLFQINLLERKSYKCNFSRVLSKIKDEYRVIRTVCMMDKNALLVTKYKTFIKMVTLLQNRNACL